MMLVEYEQKDIQGKRGCEMRWKIVLIEESNMAYATTHDIIDMVVQNFSVVNNVYNNLCNIYTCI